MVATEQPVELEDSPQLWVRARAGDGDAFCRLVRGREVRLFRQAMALCRGEAVAEDLVAETMVEAWRSLGRFDGTCRLGTWLYAILLHRYQKRVRGARSRPVSFGSMAPHEADEAVRRLSELPTEGDGPGELVIRAEWAECWLAAIRELPEIHQDVVLLRFYEDASLSEMASVLGLSLGTVKSRLHHALGKLREAKTVMGLIQEARNL